MFHRTRPAPRVLFPHIVRVKAGQTVNARLAGFPVRVSTHYHSGRTHPCIRTTHNCPLCATTGSPRYYAYWPIRGATGKAAAIELTELAEFCLLQALPDPDSPIGTPVTFHRPSGRRNNPIEVSIPFALSNENLLKKTRVEPVDEDEIRRTLFHLWNLPERPAGTDSDSHLLHCGDILLSRYDELVHPS